LLALIERMKTGMGKEVTVSLMDAGLSSLTNQATNWWMGGHLPEPMGSGKYYRVGIDSIVA
ncbi:MAG: CoA transferase, partial [Bacteroidota bacterium]